MPFGKHSSSQSAKKVRIGKSSRTVLVLGVFFSRVAAVQFAFLSSGGGVCDLVWGELDRGSLRGLICLMLMTPDALWRGRVRRDCVPRDRFRRRAEPVCQ